MAGTTTTKKTTTKKTTATKTTAKKATTTKATAKKVTAKKTTELSVSGNKKIDTLRKEFTKQFPYSGINIFTDSTCWTKVDGSKTIAAVRRANSSGDISISGNKKIGSLEKEFEKVFGLYVEVCYSTLSSNSVITRTSDDMNLSGLNKHNEECGCPKYKLDN